MNIFRCARPFVALLLAVSLAAAGGVPPQAGSGAVQTPGRTAAARGAIAADGPRAMAGSSRPTESGIRSNPLWPWIVSAALIAGSVLAYVLINGRSKARASGAGGSAGIGALEAASSPSGARIFLDGVDTGKITPARLSGLAAGTHALMLSKDGFVDYRADVIIPRHAVISVSIPLAPFAIRVVSPRAGETYARGETVVIRWTATGGSGSGGGGAIPAAIRRAQDLAGVRIQLFQNGEMTATLAESTPNDGLFEWTIPATAAPSESCFIRVSCPTDETIAGQSATFALTAIRKIRLEWKSETSWGAEIDPRMNSFVIRATNSARIGALRYGIRLGDSANTMDCTVTLEGPNRTSLKLFDRDLSQWTWLTTPDGDRDHVLDLNGTTGFFNGGDMRGDWTLWIQVFNDYCGDRGGCGGLIYFWIEVEIEAGA